MNATSKSSHAAPSTIPFKPSRWQTLVLWALGFWLSSSLILDFVFMPGLYVSGMMESPDFTAAGYTLFWGFNRVEILCAALILTAILVLRQRQRRNIMVSGSRSRWAVELAGGLLLIPVIYAYGLTPAMSAVGMPLDAAPLAVAPAMNQLHGLYWGLECLKLLAGFALLRLCYSDLAPIENT